MISIHDSDILPMRTLSQPVRVLLLTGFLSTSWALIPFHEAFAQSLRQSQQLPSNQPTSSQPTADTRGTDTQPFIVKPVEPYKSEAARKQEEAERAEKAENDRSIAWWTKVLGGLTGILALVAMGQLWMFSKQLKIMESSVKDAENAAKTAQTSADAAKQSGDALMFGQRAYLAVLVPNVVPGESEIFVELGLTNFGNTPARKVTHTVKLHVLEEPWSLDQALPDQGEFRNIEATVFPGFPQSAGAKLPIATGILDRIKAGSKEEIIPGFKGNTISAGSKFLYVIGTAQYEDVFGGKQSTRFFLHLRLQERVFCNTMPTHNDAT